MILLSENLPSSKTEAIKKIMRNLNEYKSFKEIKEIFENEYGISVTKTHVRNIGMELYDDGELELTAEIEGNNVAKKIRPKEDNNK